MSLSPLVPTQFPSISGLYEVGIGTREPIALIQYWEQFGYNIGQIGELSKETANKLYGVNSSLRSIRLYHQDANHGLIRLMVWDNPTDEGLQMTSMKALGNRWTTTLTADILNLLNQVEEAAAEGWSVKFTYPRWEIIYPTGSKRQPFLSPAIGVREMLLLQPLTRQVLFQRFNYTMANYGKIHLNAPLKTSQITHMGTIVQDDSQETLQFYEEVLGLLRVRNNQETSYESSIAAREMFELEPDERFWVTAFDDPRSSKTDLQAARSGRLYIIRFAESLKLADRFEKSRPGCLGMSLYTYRVGEIEAYFKRVKASSAAKVTDIVSNEFGEESFSFVAPDGYFWTLVSQSS